MRKLFHVLFHRLEAGLILYGLYTCGIYLDDADDWYSLLYGEQWATE